MTYIWLMICPVCKNYMSRPTLEYGKWECKKCGWREYVKHFWYVPLFLFMLTFYISSLVAVTININNKWEIERQKWKPLIEVNKDLPEVISNTLVLFYKSKDGISGLSIYVEVDNRDKDRVIFIDQIVSTLHKKLTEVEWYPVEFNNLFTKRNYGITIIHTKNDITISLSKNGRHCKKVYDDETNANNISLEILSRLLGVEV